jgi:hypothetical protein
MYPYDTVVVKVRRFKPSNVGNMKKRNSSCSISMSGYDCSIIDQEKLMPHT